MKIEDKETRYYIDVDINSHRIVKWDYDQREHLTQEADSPLHHRIFLTKGQYKKFVEKVPGAAENLN